MPAQYNYVAFICHFSSWALGDFLIFFGAQKNWRTKLQLPILPFTDYAAKVSQINRLLVFVIAPLSIFKLAYSLFFEKKEQPFGIFIKLFANVYFVLTVFSVRNNSPTSITKVSASAVAIIILAGIALICVIVAMILLFGYYGFGLISAIPLAIAGITSLIGLLISIKYLAKEGYLLGKAGFYSNLVLQILAIILTILMFVFFF